MKVAFFTPLDERSAIGQVSLRVIEGLAHAWDVDVWYPMCDRPAYTSLPTIPFDDGHAAARQVAQYDLAVYAIGDSPHHLEILTVARMLPGLVIAHDRTLVHLIQAYHQATGQDLLSDFAARSSKPGVTELLADYEMGIRGSLTRLAGVLPMTEVALHHSLGVVTHSRSAAEQFRGETAGSVHVAALPLLHDRAAAPRTDDELVLLVAGMVNPNKCVDRLVRAVAASHSLSTRASIRVVGAVSVEHRSAMLALAKELRLEGRLHFSGSLPREQFEAALDAATVFICLRDPVLEAASASLLEEMARARPVVVYDHGHYAEMPDDAVVKVDAAGGQTALVEALESLLDDPERAREIGRNGRRHVMDRHTVSAYVEVLIAAGEDALRARSLVHGLRNLSRLLAGLGLDRDAYVRHRLATAVAELFLPDTLTEG